MVSLWIVLYYMYFRCFARRCFTHASVMRDMYCLRYSLLASQSKLRLVGCGSLWAGDVNNAMVAGESQLLARPRHASAGRRRLVIGREEL